MEQALKVLTVMLVSAFKFLFSGLVSFGMGYSFLETLIYMAIGGSVGALVFFILGKTVLEWFRKRYVRKCQERVARGIPPKKIFTRTNRTIVRIKHKYGMFGLVAFTPPILSIPITSLLAAKYFKHDRRTLPSLVGSILLWSVVLTTMWSFLR